MLIVHFGGIFSNLAEIFLHSTVKAAVLVPDALHLVLKAVYDVLELWIALLLVLLMRMHHLYTVVVTTSAAR